MDADAVELRVLGCLLEKQRTTPDQYPLSLNALRLACNQTTNRDPIVSFEEREIHEALQRLARRGWTRLASGAGSRAAKYRQLFDQELGLADADAAVICVLLLRGAADSGRAQAANRPTPPLRGSRRGRGNAGRARRPRSRRAARAETGTEGGALPPSPRGRRARCGTDRRETSRRWRRKGVDHPSLATRVAALEADVAQLRAELRALSGSQARPHDDERRDCGGARHQSLGGRTACHAADDENPRRARNAAARRRAASSSIDRDPSAARASATSSASSKAVESASSASVGRNSATPEGLLGSSTAIAACEKAARELAGELDVVEIAEPKRLLDHVSGLRLRDAAGRELRRHLGNGLRLRREGVDDEDSRIGSPRPHRG